MVALIWSSLIPVVILLIALDLGVFQRKTKQISPQEALAWTGFWVCLALAFNVLVYFLYEGHWLGAGIVDAESVSGSEAALQFFTGYLIEKSLSLNNIFIIALIFVHFRVRLRYQHRILFWGVIGALFFRAIMICSGSVIFQHFFWATYVFGVILLYSAVRLLVARHDNLQIDNNPLTRLVRRYVTVTKENHGVHFFVKTGGKYAVTPLLLVLLVVQSTNVLFAVDSIPAIFGVTRDPFLVFTSNVFALLGLRSLYFALAGLMSKFRYMKMSLVFIVTLVGINLILSNHFQTPSLAALIVLLGILAVGIAASIIASKRDTAPLVSPLEDELEEIATLTVQIVNKILIILIGSSVILIGIPLLVLPGPGILTIVLGLTILGTQFIWARKLVKRVKEEAHNIETKIKKAVNNRRKS